MPEKFITSAVLGFILFALLAAWLHSTTLTTTNAGLLNNKFRRRRVLYINSLQLIGICVFLGLAYPALFFMSGFSPRIALSVPTLTTWILLSLLLCTVLIAAWPGRFHIWWSPMPLLQSMLAASTFASWLGESQGLPYPLWPDWRYIGGALVLYLAALILVDALLWATRKNQVDRSFVPEFARLCTVLPALLVYAVGVRV